jgi:diguanylate cyclase (GGDEF)-like protein
VHMALHDSLTELPNRTLLNERLEHALTRVRRGEMVAAHTLDLDHFKTVNDTLGHPIGDKLLKEVTERLLGLVRETDTVARMGGDEFAIIQVAISQPADATTLAHRIIEVVSKPYDIDGQQIDIGASIGIAMAPADGDTPDDLLRNSDLALYRAKGDGRGTFCFFESDMDAQMQARRALEYDLRRAVPAKEFELHYQPVIDLKSNQISSFEALVRWRHPRNGLVPPGLFIPLAEKLGVIIALGEWAIRDACMTASSWSRELSVAVNLSPRQFRNPGLVQIVSGALEYSGLPPHRLELDITEPVMMGDSEATLSVLHSLRDLGVKLAMDDFGTGYASLSYLHSFAFDKIKIDRSFVKSVAADTGCLNVVRAVAAMAHSLGISTTAEGVETLEQLEIVRMEGCTEIQGFLFSPALPASEIDKILKRRIRFGVPAEAENAA